MKKNEYYLFLDESKPNGDKINHLCLAGIIVLKEDYENLIINDVNKLKTNIFDGTSIVLHEVEVRQAREDFRCLRNRQKREDFWDELNNIFSNPYITTIGAAVNYPLLEQYYNKDSLKNQYFMVLQLVLENFVHFLENNNGVGYVNIESTDNKSDLELKNVYFDIVANGTLFYSQNVFQSRLININFFNKKDNNIGLQLADFIPGALNRTANGLTDRELTATIESSLYCSIHNKKDRFGFKVIP